MFVYCLYTERCFCLLYSETHTTDILLYTVPTSINTYNGHPSLYCFSGIFQKRDYNQVFLMNTELSWKFKTKLFFIVLINVVVGIYLVTTS